MGVGGGGTRNVQRAPIHTPPQELRLIIEYLRTEYLTIQTKAWCKLQGLYFILWLNPFLLSNCLRDLLIAVMSCHCSRFLVVHHIPSFVCIRGKSQPSWPSLLVGRICLPHLGDQNVLLKVVDSIHILGGKLAYGFHTFNGLMSPFGMVSTDGGFLGSFSGGVYSTPSYCWWQSPSGEPIDVDVLIWILNGFFDMPSIKCQKTNTQDIQQHKTQHNSTLKTNTKTQPAPVSNHGVQCAFHAEMLNPRWSDAWP